MDAVVVLSKALGEDSYVETNQGCHLIVSVASYCSYHIEELWVMQ